MKSLDNLKESLMMDPSNQERADKVDKAEMKVDQDQEEVEANLESIPPDIHCQVQEEVAISMEVISLS